MRPTFLLNSSLKPVSALVRKGVDAGETLSVGTSIHLVKDFTTPYGVVSAGTKGFVEYVDPENGTTEIRMEGWEPALMHWGNILILVPFDTDDLADAIVCALRQASNLVGDNVTQFRTASN